MASLKWGPASAGALIAIFSTAQVIAQNQLEEVLVTATKRVESISDVPVSVAAMTGDLIAKSGISDLNDLVAMVPNVQFSGSTILPNIYVRGVGSGSAHVIEQSAGSFIDDVYIGRAAISFHGYYDLESVEMLRGPQGTLFGKNTAAGAIIVRTAAPTPELALGANAYVGQYETTGGYEEVQGFVSGPFSDTVRGRIAVRYRNEDGFLDNQLPGPDGADREDHAVRGRLDWNLGENTTVKLKAEYAELEIDGDASTETIGDITPFQAFLPPGTQSGLDWISFVDCEVAPIVNRDTSFPPDGVPDVTSQTSPFCPGRHQETSNYSLNLSHDTSVGTLTSISAYQTYEYDHRFVALDTGAAGGKARFERVEKYHGFTEELRFTSEPIGRADLIIGAYYEDSSLDRKQPSHFNLVEWPGVDAFLSREENWHQDTTTIAGYAQVRFQFTDSVRAILGGRYSDEEKEFQYDRIFYSYADPTTPIPASDQLNTFLASGPFGVPLSYTDSRSESKFTPDATLQWISSGDLMLYASFAQGYKSGGFDDRITNLLGQTIYDPEEVDNYEVGLKGKWLDGRLAANIAVFYMDVNDMQVAAAVPNALNIPQFAIVNAGKATSRGVELEANWLVSEHLIIGGNASYLDAQFDDFPGAQCPPGETPGANGLCNLAGYPLIYAPEWQGLVFADFHAQHAIGDWDLALRAEVTHSDEYFTDILYAPKLSQDAYEIYNASIRLTSPAGAYSIALLGKNIDNTIAQEWASPSIPFFALPNKPREIALSLSLRF